MDFSEPASPGEAGTKMSEPSQPGDEMRIRADVYSILSSLLNQAPKQDVIDSLRHIASSDGNAETGDIGQAWHQLRQAALDTDIDQLDDEYHDLFIGLGRGQVVPYGSWHITGFLMDKPLSELRDDLRKLGIEADPDQRDPEDHISALCEAMSIIILSEDIEGYRQRQFYIQHIYPWAGKFFRELQSANAASFYKSVGLLGQAIYRVRKSIFEYPGTLNRMKMQRND